MRELKRSFTFLSLTALLVGVGGCIVEQEQTDEVDADTEALLIGGFGDGPRCSTTQQGEWIDGDFVITGTTTSGCEEGDVCVVFACSNSIPASCIGTCQAASSGP